jgi:hypothetical protein
MGKKYLLLDYCPKNKKAFGESNQIIPKKKPSMFLKCKCDLRLPQRNIEVYLEFERGKDEERGKDKKYCVVMVLYKKDEYFENIKKILKPLSTY